MFREIRRKKNELSEEAAKSLLKTQKRGVLSVIGDDGYPYGVPINFIYSENENKIYFHGSEKGHKADSIRNCSKVCFTVYGKETVKEEEWAPYVQSAIVFGKCEIVTDRCRTIELVRKFARRYYPDDELVEAEISRSGSAVRMYEISIEHMSGKQIQER